LLWLLTGSGAVWAGRWASAVKLSALTAWVFN
jgi:hypothetical protein